MCTILCSFTINDRLDLTISPRTLQFLIPDWQENASLFSKFHLFGQESKHFFKNHFVISRTDEISSPARTKQTFQVTNGGMRSSENMLTHAVSEHVIRH